MMQEMTPEEIKEKKPYLDWSLSEEEYDYICDKLLHRLPNYTETGLFSAMWSEQDRKSTRLNSSHTVRSRMPSSA